MSYPPSDRPGRERRGDLPAIWVGVPPRNPYFTGREDLLRDIHERLTGKVPPWSRMRCTVTAA